jgi:hypothetical protein
MMMKPIIAGVLAFVCSLGAQSSKPDVTGTWKMDVARSETAKVVPWYERQELLVITSTATELRVERPGSLPVTYRLDGSEWIYDEGSGDPARKMKTQLMWTSATLITRATPVREDTDPQSGKVTSTVGVTMIESYTLVAGGTQLKVEKSGQRSKVPPTLHGLPYDPKTDPLVQKYTDVFVRAPG